MKTNEQGMPNSFMYYVALAGPPQKFPLLYASFMPVKRERRLLDQAETRLESRKKTMFETLCV